MTVAKVKVNVANKNRKVSNRVPSQFPAFYKEIDSQLIRFVQAYYRWMEQSEGILSDGYMLPNNTYHRTAEDRFWDAFRNEFMASIPKSALADRRLLLENIKEFYRSRGSEQSYQFLFRILYDADVSITYPKDDIFRSSAAKWIKKIYIKIQAVDNESLNFQSKKIYGVQSGATCLVERVELEMNGLYSVAILEVSNIVGMFFNDEPIQTKDNGSNLYGRILGQVTSYLIDSSGVGYLPGDPLIITNPGDGDGFAGYVESVDQNGSVLGIRIQNTGAGYFTAPIIDIMSTNGSGASIRLNVSSTFYSPGEYRDSRHQPSGISKLQDGRFYQEFSYQIESSVSIDQYRDIVLQLLHPSGTEMFGYINGLDPNGDVTVVGDLLFHLSHPEDINYKNPNHPSSRRFFEPEIQIQSRYMTFERLMQMYPNASIGDLYEMFLNEFWSVLYPTHRSTIFGIEANKKFFIAKRDADTFIDLYDESMINPFANMIIGDIEPYTGYPNPKLSDITVLP